MSYPQSTMAFVGKFSGDHFYRNSAAILLNTSSMALFGLVFWIIASRFMPSSDVGFATVAISASTLIATIARMGMADGLIRFLPDSRDKNRLYNSIVFVTTACALLLAVLFVFVAPYFSPSLSFLGGGFAAVAFVALTALLSLNYMQNTALVAIRRGGLSFIQNLLLALRIPAIIAVAYLGLTGILFSYGLVYLLAFGFGIYLLSASGLSSRLEADTGEVRRISGFSLGSYVADILTMIPSAVMPMLILILLGPVESAYFYIAYSLIVIMSLVPYSVATALFVEGSHGMALRHNALKSLSFAVLILLPVLIIVLLFGDWLLLLFGREYSVEAVQLLKLLAVACFLSLVPGTYIAIKKIRKEMRGVNAVSVLNSGFLLGLSYVMVRWFGLIGVGYAWLITSIALGVVVIVAIIFIDRWIS